MNRRSDPNYVYTDKDRARFESMYIPEPNSGCWLWNGGVHHADYGSFWVNGRCRAAHKVSYEMHVGPLPLGSGYHGTCVRHRCDVPSCVNPAHLIPGSHRDNMRDMVARGRTKRAAKAKQERTPRHLLRGERHASARIADVVVAELRELYARGGITQRELAARYGIGQSHVWRIIKMHSRAN